ncbi:MAG: MerR family transcriptional regulator [Actinomycetota bacterium]
MEELAARSGMGVDTVRFYQARGLLPPPAKSGRIAWYSDEHLERLGRIRELKDKGFTLAMIKLALAGELHPADQALLAALAAPLPEEEAAGGNGGAGETFSLEELAERSGFPLPLLLALQAEGLLIPRTHGGEPRYTGADIRAAAAGLSLLEAGVPLDDLLALAREYDRAARRTAGWAIELFEAHVRDPIRASSAGSNGEEAAQELVEAFRRLLPATTFLVTHHFRRVLLAEAQARFERAGAASRSA